jgi:DNA anti-recombination protein RmuC
MNTNTETSVYDQVLENMKKAAETGLKMQQDTIQQWATLWPGIPTPQTVWMDKIRDFQKQWNNAVSELANKHRATLDRQYQAAIDSLENALRAGESSNPEEFRQRTEQFFRKSLECMREATEAQLKENQEAMNKLADVFTKIGA